MLHSSILIGITKSARPLLLRSDLEWVWVVAGVLVPFHAVALVAVLDSSHRDLRGQYSCITGVVHVVHVHVYMYAYTCMYVCSSDISVSYVS